MGKLTAFTSTRGPLTKTYWKSGSTKSPGLSEGTFEVKEIPDHGSLMTLIKSLTHKQALSYSIPLGHASGSIAIKGLEYERSGIISRSKEFFDYSAEEGWLYVDVDEDLSETEVIKRLGNLHGPFGDTSYVYATSASHGINGKKGFHLYFKVEDISIVKQAMDNLFKCAFNAGYGKCVVSEGGSVLNRTFFDTTVYAIGPD